MWCCIIYLVYPGLAISLGALEQPKLERLSLIENVSCKFEWRIGLESFTTFSQVFPDRHSSTTFILYCKYMN